MGNGGARPAPRVSNLIKARRAYAEGRNVTELLRAEAGLLKNTPEIIEIAYDLQAGSYVEGARANRAALEAYTAEVAGHLAPHLPDKATILDIGTGEMTTLALILKALAAPPQRCLAFDISWSRLVAGLDFASEELGADMARLTPFVAELAEIPLADNAVDVTISSHALEPNGGNLEPLLGELFRVTREKLVLFEPCYEIASADGQARMERLGYIRDLPGAVENLGGIVESQTAMTNIANPLNPTACFVITPPEAAGETVPGFTIPGTSYPLAEQDRFLFSEDAGLAFPILKGLPVLRLGAGILATGLGTASQGTS